MVDARTPVIVGVGQSAENIGDSSYRGMSSVELAALSDTVAGIRQFEISGRTPAPLGKSNNYSRTVAQRIGADPARDPRAYRRAGAAASGHRVRERDRRRQLRRGDVVRLREHLQPPVLRGPRRQAGPIRDRRGITRRPRLWIRRHLRRVHHRARIARRPSAIRAAEERSTGPAGPQRRGLPAAHGRTVRAVHHSRRQESVLVIAGRAHGRRAHHGHRGQPDDLRSLSAAAAGQGSGQPGRGGAADVGRGGPSARCAAGEVGVSAWARRPGRAKAARLCRREH